VPVAFRARCHTAWSVAVRNGRPARAWEHEVVRAGCAPGREVFLEIGDNDLRDRDLPPAGVGLRGTEQQRAVGELLVLLDDRDDAM
jgi:hypothetical protein